MQDYKEVRSRYYALNRNVEKFKQEIIHDRFSFSSQRNDILNELEAMYPDIEKEEKKQKFQKQF